MVMATHAVAIPGDRDDVACGFMIIFFYYRRTAWVRLCPLHAGPDRVQCWGLQK